MLPTALGNLPIPNDHRKEMQQLCLIRVFIYKKENQRGSGNVGLASIGECIKNK